jgi:enoyl-CoA hydratase/carnithine racemase
MSARLGLDNAKRLFLTAEKLNGRQMKEIGFLTHLVKADTLEEEVLAPGPDLCGHGSDRHARMKRHLNRIARGTLHVEDLEADIRRAMDSADLREGLAAWAQKARARFSGK